MRNLALATVLCLVAGCSSKSLHTANTTSTISKDSRTSAGATSSRQYAGNVQTAPNITRILRASQQRILPSPTSKNAAYTEYRLQVLWREPKAPSQLLYRTSTDQWIACQIKKKTGRDTLYLYGKDPVTYQIKISNPTPNALYFNNPQGDWQYIQAKGLRVLKDVKMH